MVKAVAVLVALLVMLTGFACAESTANETPIILDMNGTEVHGFINNTVTAQAFLQLLPYTVTVNRAADDLCGTVLEELPVDAAETKTEWKIGEIGWFGGWFTILCDHEEQFSNMPGISIIGTINDEEIPFVASLTGTVDIAVKLDDSRMDGKKGVEEMLSIRVNDQEFTATLENNSSAQALKDLLSKGDITIDMRDFANMEKVGSLGSSLPTNDMQITTGAGDLILYQGSAFVIYYAPNSWNFTRLGKINNVTANELKAILGDGAVTVTLSMKKQ